MTSTLDVFNLRKFIQDYNSYNVFNLQISIFDFFRLKLYPFPIRPDIPCPDGNTIELPLSNLEKAPWPLLLPAPCSIPKNKLFGPAVCKQIKQENQYHKAFRQLVTTVKEGYRYILKVDNCHFLDLAFYYPSHWPAPLRPTA